MVAKRAQCESTVDSEERKRSHTYSAGNLRWKNRQVGVAQAQAQAARHCVVSAITYM
jgi:hypothetical protein